MRLKGGTRSWSAAAVKRRSPAGGRAAVRGRPGITSSVAAPAAAGIPVTHRGMSAAFTVVTAPPFGRARRRLARARQGRRHDRRAHGCRPARPIAAELIAAAESRQHPSPPSTARHRSAGCLPLGWPTPRGDDRVTGGIVIGPVAPSNSLTLRTPFCMRRCRTWQSEADSSGFTPKDWGWGAVVTKAALGPPCHGDVEQARTRASSPRMSWGFTTTTPSNSRPLTSSGPNNGTSSCVS